MSTQQYRYEILLDAIPWVGICTFNLRMAEA